MKKLVSLFLLMLTCGLAFQACSDSKTYAEMLEEEKDAINNFIKTNKIKVISASEFEKNDNKTNVDENEYVQFSNGVYMQIVNYGTGKDSIKSRDVITVRFVEYDILTEDTTLTNYAWPTWLDVFDYTISGTTAYGQFRQGGLMYYNYQSSQVPEGWLVPLQYIKSGAEVKLIVPSKVGHTNAMQYVYPFYYHLRRIQVW
ncbi:DUF4827 domain-containing protein [Bacteroides sp. 51]|uniref:DUF4827 domain-containing protein n=1 Tax=Bacteroides sp. 51 TaxID=2302938 RepID=UPI0013D303AC|nr:DUF4827 domain-containing protein [Bacteroides sp. 51]NDV81176.1 DUF4827 domain-containing protein [Bacteroides sp. 51]